MLSHAEAPGVAQIDLDYVTPKFRDFTPGEFVYRRSQPLHRTGLPPGGQPARHGRPLLPPARLPPRGRLVRPRPAASPRPSPAHAAPVGVASPRPSACVDCRIRPAPDGAQTTPTPAGPAGRRVPASAGPPPRGREPGVQSYWSQLALVGVLVVAQRGLRRQRDGAGLAAGQPDPAAGAHQPGRAGAGPARPGPEPVPGHHPDRHHPRRLPGLRRRGGLAGQAARAAARGVRRRRRDRSRSWWSPWR